MIHEPENILKHFEGEIKEFIIDHFSRWHNEYSNYLTSLQIILNRYKIQLTKKCSIIEQWQFFEQKAAESLIWLNKIDYDRECKRLSEFSVKFDEAVEKLLQPMPLELKSFIPSDIWEANAKDSFMVKVNKKLFSLAYKCGKSIKKLRRKKNATNGENTNGNIHFERIIPLHRFLKNFLARPLHRFIIGQWQDQMHIISGQLLVLQLKTKEFNTRALCLDKLPTLLHDQKENEIFEIFYDLAEILRSIEETLQILNGWENQFTNKLDLTWKEISKSFQSNWQLAGTSRLSNRKYSEKILHKRKERRQQAIDRFQSAWNTHFKGIFEEWYKDFEMAIVQYQALLLMERSDKRISKRVDSDLLPSISFIQKTISNTISDFQSSEDEKSFRQILNIKSSDLLKKIQKEKLPELLDSLHQIRVENREHQFAQVLGKKIDTLPDFYTFFTSKDTKNIPPKSKTELIPLKNIIKNRFLLNLQDSHYQYSKQMEQKIESILRTSTEIDQIIEFNFDTAVTYMKFKNGNPDGFLEAKKNLIHGLEQASRLTEAISGDTRELKTESITHYDKSILTFEEEISSMDEDRLQNLKVQSGKISEIQPQIIQDKNESAIQKTKRVPEKGNISTFDYTSAFAAQMAKLPYTYARLFSLDSLEDDRFYLARPHQTDQLTKAFQTWKNGGRSLTLITGSYGSGRKTFLNNMLKNNLHTVHAIHVHINQRIQSEKDLVNLFCRSFGFDTLENFESLASEIKEKKISRICLLKELQNIVLSVVDGFNLLHSFIQFVLETQHVLFWIVVTENYALNYLNKINDIQKFFQVCINMDGLSSEALNTLLLKRHRISGYDLYFQPEEESMNSKNMPKLIDSAELQSFYKDDFYKSLNEYSQGNICVGLLYWLWSIKNFQDDKLVLATRVKVDFSTVEALKRNDLLVINTILQHGALSAHACAQVFREDKHSMSIQLNKLLQLGILRSKEDMYHIQPFLIPAILKLLRENKLAN